MATILASFNYSGENWHQSNYFKVAPSNQEFIAFWEGLSLSLSPPSLLLHKPLIVKLGYSQQSSSQFPPFGTTNVGRVLERVSNNRRSSGWLFRLYNYGFFLNKKILKKNFQSILNLVSKNIREYDVIYSQQFFLKDHEALN